MIITDDFVMLNFPKTGSSFARKAIKKAYAKKNSGFKKVLEKYGFREASIEEVLKANMDERKNLGIKTQHGTFRQIPEKHNMKKIVSITRNPLLRYESAYFFKWWQKHPPADIQEIQKKYPNFPDLSFLEYYEMINFFGKLNRLKNIKPQIDLGIHTVQFIQFYFDNPESVLKKINHEYIDNELFRNDMPPIQFLHQENLNAELKSFLMHSGFSNHHVDFIDSEKKINVTEKKQNSNDCIKLDKATQETIRKRDKLLFKLFPEYMA